MNTALTAPQVTNWEDQELVKAIKDTVCRGATDSQFRMFAEVCKATGLNPWLREIWFVPNVGVMAGRDGYLRIANDHPMFDGMSTTVERDAEGIPIKATCSVWRKDRAHPITCEAFYNEYRKNSQVWQTYKSAMISKVAEVLALKRSFSINGIVTEEEIGEHKLAAQDAQQDVAQRKIKELSAPKYNPNNLIPHAKGCDVWDTHTERICTCGADKANDKMLAVPPATIIELADSLDQPPEPPLMAPDVRKPPSKSSAYELREAAKRDEAIEIISAADAKIQRKRGSISFAALKQWGEIKKEILALTGTTDLYYEALKAGGYSHADEIRTPQDAAKIWKALKAITAELSQSKKSKADEALLLEAQTHALRIGPYATKAVLERKGLQSIDEILNLGGDDLTDLLKELKSTA